MKSTKSALKKAIGETILTPMELYTCLLEVANLLNQRPIGKLSEDPDDGTYLYPNDILLGRATSTVPQGPFRETSNPRHRFDFCQKIVDSFCEFDLVTDEDVLKLIRCSTIKACKLEPLPATKCEVAIRLLSQYSKQQSICCCRLDRCQRILRLLRCARY